MHDPFLVECSSWWDDGQGYVALSRASDPNLMYLENFTTKSRLRLNDRVRCFHDWIRGQPLPVYVPDAERTVDARESERLQSVLAVKRARSCY